MAPLRENRTLNSLLTVGLVLLGFAWLVLPAWYFFGAFITSASFLGETASAADQAAAGDLLVRAGVLAAGLPLIGVIVASYLGHNRVRNGFGAAFALGAIVAIVLIGASGQVSGGSPAPAPSKPAGCQEHSGGGNTCPGG